MHRPRVTILTSVAALVSSALAPAALAQSASGPAVETANDGALEEIVVTAQKREQRLQDVPIAVTALSGAQLQDLGAVDLRDVAKQTPGLFYRSFSNAATTLYMRGIGTRAYDAGSESSVGTFIDGVYMGRFGSQLQDVADVERVEVLRGPQGSLFGRNTIGGAINVVTRQPKDQLYASGNLTYGRETSVASNTLNADGLISGPIVGDTVLGQLALSRSDVGGSTRILGTNRLANGSGTESARGRLVFKASDALRVDLSADYFKSLADPYNWVWHTNSVNGTRPFVFGYLGAPPVLNPDPYTANVTPPKSNANREGWGTNLTLNYSTANVELTSIAAYRNLRDDYFNDTDAKSLDVVNSAADETASQFSEELRVASAKGGAATLDGKIDWLLGLYYYEERVDRSDTIPASPDGIFAAPTAAAAKVNTKSWAAFGQMGINLSEKWRIDLGLRHSDDRKTGDFASTGFLTFGVPFSTSDRNGWTSTDPSASLSYKISDDVMAFAKYSTGFKSGAYQFIALSAAQAQQVANPEKVKSSEVGLRADWLDRRLRTNVNVFNYDYSDIQVPNVSTVSGLPLVVLSNAAKSNIRGVEIEGAALFSAHWELDYSYAYLDARYDKYVYNATKNYSGNRMVRAPQNTLGAALVFSQPYSMGDLKARIGVNYVSSFFFEPDNAKIDAGTEEPSHTTVDASVAFTHDAYTFKLWATNLTNEAVRATVLNPGSPVLLNEMWMPRRTVGVTLSAKLR